MPLTLPLPDWVPWWAQLVILVGAILLGFALLAMPFSVFGLKGRLDFMQAQLDDIHAELRMIASRLPDPERPVREPVFEQLSSRPVQQREPSPTWTAAARAAAPPEPQRPVADRLQPSARAEPTPRTAPVFTPPVLTSAPEPARPVPQRRPLHADDPTPMRAAPAERGFGLDRAGASDWDDGPAEMLPRRPLRATTIRATTLRDPARDRSEPVLRFPPPR